MSGTPGVAPRKTPQVQDPWGARPGARGGPGTCGQGGGAPDSRRPPAGLTRGDLHGAPGPDPCPAPSAPERARHSCSRPQAASTLGGQRGARSAHFCPPMDVTRERKQMEMATMFPPLWKAQEAARSSGRLPAPPTPTPRDGDPLAAEPAVRPDGGGRRDRQVARVVSPAPLSLCPSVGAKAQ